MMPCFNSGDGIFSGMSVGKWCVEVDSILMRKYVYETALISEVGREQVKNVKTARENADGPQDCE